ncbi:MAG TPA: SDR family NAD(P)-dependent oxidoreductase [Fibrobacteria bacterium]|nr:SDR family NAD(P)-dependent oxidoreductase [Fibrobacteria bacterium]
MIGLSGRYPEAEGIAEYWRNLRDGKDCIVEIPASRWDWREFYTPDRNRPGSHYSKWGGFIAGVDEFDPRFFNISPLEAGLMDPQERLFLQHAWMAMEDAGYTRAALQVPDAGDQAGQVGVYAGVMYGEYQLFGSAAGPREKRLAIPGSYASIANRVSYLLNLHGPSLTLDSMCSSSLTAIHLACQDLKLGRTSMAIAGGVNVSIHPNKYLVISAGQFISGDGHCQSFGEGGEGYIPGEGVGVVMLKRISDALRDGDHVYGIIRASALNHGGKTNGYSVPNPQAQAGAIARALSECGVDARHVSYVEAHGTGTKLGDPIEIAALTQAFRRHTEENGFCRIGSAKSNIGHAESAAGIAGLTKVLLQMRHGQLVPSLHSARLNPHIDFAKTPFVVNQALCPWDRPSIGGREIPRLAGLSSFGAGGSNAHLVIEEFVPARKPAAAIPGHGGVAILLSARTPEQLGRKIRDLLAFVRGEDGPERDDGALAALAYTLQTGREAMDERLGFVTASFEDLERRLEACAGGEAGEGLFRGRAEGDADTLALFHDDADLQQTLGKWIAQGKLEKLLGLWVKGLKLDWNRLYAGARPRRMSLPAYPFARERYWVDAAGARPKPGTATLHPLLHANVSDLTRQRYATVFTGEEPFLADHQVRLDGVTRKVLPAAACLEMARAAVEKSLPHAEGVLELRDLSWSRPIVVGEETPISIELTPDSDGSLAISVLGRDGEEEIVHFEGKAAFVPADMPAPLDLAGLAAGMGNPALDSTRLYSAYARMGLEYGPTHRTVTEVLRGEGRVLARLRLPDTAAGGLADFLLHPGLADGALQSALGLADPDRLPAQPAIPFALASLRVLAPCTQAMAAWVRRSAGAAPGDALAPLDIDLCDGEGRICAQWRGLASRPVSRPISRRDPPEAAAEEGILMAVPAWEAAPIPLPPDGPAAYARQVILIGMRTAAERIGGLPAPALTIPGPEGGNGAAHYRETARQCFELVQRTLATRSDREALVQIVVADAGEQALCAGLTGLLRTASLEDPRLAGQLILCEPEVPAEELARRLAREALNPVAPMIRYLRGERQVLAWRELPPDPARPSSAYRQDGVYLITGGLGGLGLLFARDILARAPGARVVLTGRSELPGGKLALLEEMAAGAQRLRYLPLDLADAERVREAVASVAEEYGRLDGVLHCAGMVADNLIVRKSVEEFLRVLEPKIAGTCNLDAACRDLRLDFLALFSSAAGALGNPGQADYAAANGFMDQFAAWRNRLAASGQRHGHTLSLDWPLWREGGMGLDAEGRELLFRASGMRPMDTAAGLEAFHRAFLSRPSQVLVLQGDLARLRTLLRPGRSAAAPSFPAMAPVDQVATVAQAGSAGEAAGLVTAAAEYLRDEFAQVLKLRPGEIDPKAPLEKYGIDSILAMRLTGKLEETFGALPKTLFFEYQNVAGLAAFFAGKYPALIRARAGLAGSTPAALLPSVPAPGGAYPAPGGAYPAPGGKAAPRAGSRKARFLAGPESRDDIAIVGLGGRYPQAENLERFWENLKAGRDCITEIPLERWDGGRYFDQSKGATGKSRSKWGGFLSDVDKFDPLFFNISPQEAELMDPQERLFLETAWETVEDAGYSKERLAASRVGVYVGVMYGQYELYGSEAMARGDAYVPGSSFASIANRVSYLFDFRGPSLAVDTMCSSSLTAIYLACEEIRKGGIDAALAGGVNLSLHPQKYLLLSQGNFTASDGRCRSFGAGGDGYVPGEGVGAVLLKPLSKALADGDHVYGVIKAMALNHGGKTNGYTVPNPNAQADLIGGTLRQSGIDPATVGYLEAHGTGTSLGDPIEIAGLMKAFAGRDGRAGRGICAIGSVKSNIGHLESAAGIASLTKALLQLKHRMLVPSLHAEPANPNIDFASTCFRVQTRLEPWESPAGQPRRIGISSFGAGGSNAHLILEECPEAQGREPPSEDLPEAFLLSAKGGEALRRYATRMVGFLERVHGIPLARLAFTSQVGRTSLKDRLAVLASSREELADKLKRWLEAAPGAGAMEAEGIFRGDALQARSEAGTLMEGEAGAAFLRALAENREAAKLAKLWAAGGDVDWALLGRRIRPQRVSLPTYPFARERHWIKVSPPAPPPAPARPAIPAAPSEAEVPVPVAARPESPRRYAFRSCWREAATNASEVGRLAGPVLLLGEDEALHRGLRAWAESESPGHPLIQVRWEPAYREITADVIALDPGNERHWYRFAAWLKAGDRLPRLIVHHGMRPVGMDEEEGAGLQLDRGVYALFHLCKGLVKHRHQVPVRILSLQSDGPGVALPLHAALGGFLKTLALENPKYQGKVVSLQGGPESPEARAEAMIRILRAELGEKSWTRKEIQYRFLAPGPEPLRSVRELAPLPLEAARTEAGFRQKGVYLVSGGLGGLGLVFSAFLAERFQAKLVLFGRSAPGADQEKKLARLRTLSPDVMYLRADVGRYEDMRQVVEAAKGAFGRIDGVVHSAGVNRDNFLFKKSREEMEGVIGPKVFGALNLDRATRGEDLDLFVLFSSVAGVLGNPGQCDYAYGNHFLDAFAECREQERRQGRRSGKSLSISWPYWEAGGMTLSPADIEQARERIGLCPLPTEEGIRYWEDLLRAEAAHGIALYGIGSRMAAFIGLDMTGLDLSRIPAAQEPAAAPERPATADVEEAAGAYLKALIGAEIKLDPDRIDARERFESFGIDSIVISRLNIALERDLGEIPKTLFYEYETVEELAEHLAREFPAALARRHGNVSAPAAPATQVASAVPEAAANEAALPPAPVAARPPEEDGRIAIIGMHGHFPGSRDLEAFWENLKRGKDSIGPVPSARWDGEKLYDPDPEKAAEGKIYCKWGGFLEDVDKFDPRFFNIPPEEAGMIDPQERIFLESVWAAVEDAGYTRAGLKRRHPKGKSADVGVFVGVTTNSYHLLGAEAWSRGNAVSPGSLPWSIANRVSYLFDFQGPSLPIDTACSSSLVAMHLACESLKRRECQVAIAGGVNLYLHPSKYLSFCQKRSLSPDGKCRSFGAGEEGFVPGEGVGTLVLKRLDRAVADGDRVLAVIAGSAYDHSGRSNGYSAPNPKSQATLIDQAMRRARVNPESIGCVEGHGTATRMGDSLEVAALSQAFRKQTAKKQFCSLGSVKANIGHAESAAGIAGVAKALLQLRHRQFAPTLHSDPPNPDLALGESPFFLQRGLGPWEAAPGQPRRAMVNAFGAGGVNACVILEEFAASIPQPRPAVPRPRLFILSARDEDSLRKLGGRLSAFLRAHPETDPEALAYTLQVGREAMAERAALVAADGAELALHLEHWLGGKPVPALRRNGARGGRNGASSSARAAHANAAWAAGDLEAVADAWLAGAEIDWDSLHAADPPARLALPAYPFARERHWIPQAAEPLPAAAALHPLLHSNTSSLREIGFASRLSPEEFYARDHKVNRESLFPGSGYLELACVAGNIAGEQRVAKLQDVVWVHPLGFSDGARSLRTCLKPVGSSIEYRIVSVEGGREKVHSEGRMSLQNGGRARAQALSLAALKDRCPKRMTGEQCYERFRRIGFDYGPSFRTLQEIHAGPAGALARLKLPDHLKPAFGAYILHPSLLDGALQTVIGLVDGAEPSTPYLPFAIDEVELLRPLSQACHVWVEPAGAAKAEGSGLKKFDITLLNDGGDALVKLKGFYVRALAKAPVRRHAEAVA